MVKKTKKIYNIRWKKCDQNFQLEHKVAHLASLPPSKQVLLFISYQASQLDCIYDTCRKTSDSQLLQYQKKKTMGGFLTVK